MYRVIRYFKDLTDGSYAYSVGDTFPRAGLSVSPERYAELQSASNRRGMPLIVQVGIPSSAPVEPLQDAKTARKSASAKASKAADAEKPKRKPRTVKKANA